MISKTKKIFLGGVFGLSALVGGYFLIKNREIGVSTGEIKYSAGKILRADGVSACSVIVIGNESGAVMAHAFPENVVFLHREKRITTENAVRECIRELEDRAFDIGGCEAIVNAGTKKGYDKLTEDLSKRGIRVRGSFLEEGGKARNVYYDIGGKKMKVEYFNK